MTNHDEGERLDPRWLSWLRAWIGFETYGEKQARIDRDANYLAYLRKHFRAMTQQSVDFQRQGLEQARALQDPFGGSTFGLF